MNESQIFAEALKFATPHERAAYLDAACAGDSRLRADLDALLRVHGDDPGFLEEPVAGLGLTTAEKPSPASGGEKAGAVLGGRYKLLEPVGEGGMGSVWMAQQQEPVKRLVAVKLIKAGMDSKQVLARFDAERQALALMDHPNIAKVLDGGTTSAGRPYFVMDLVKGVPITRYCDEHLLTPRQRLELFIPVCQAIQHAHQKGIIHRDVKPSNVLIALYDDKPVPKVIDFGIAKATGQQLTEGTLNTGFGAVVGTLEYMSPEQAGFNQLDVDTRSDVYSLGVLLYELLTGSPPFSRRELENAGMLEMLRVIREQEPSKPSTRLSTADGLPTLATNRGMEPKRLAALLRGELDWIAMKALEKDRSHRYESANGIAMDVQRYLREEAVSACPPTALYHFRKFARRNKTALTTVVLIALALVLGAGISIWQAVRATDAEALAYNRLLAKEQALKDADTARGQASDERDAAKHHLYQSQVQLAQSDLAEGNIKRLVKLLDDQRPHPGQRDLRDWEWYFLRSVAEKNLLTIRDHTKPVRAVAWSPDGMRLASASDDASVRIWDAANGRALLSFAGHPAPAWFVCWSPDGTRLASASEDGTVKVWKAATGEELFALATPRKGRRGVAWSPDGQYLAVWGFYELQIWNAKTGEHHRDIPVLALVTDPRQIKPALSAVAWRPEDGQLAAAAHTGQLWIWNAKGGLVKAVLPGPGVMTCSMAWSPDGRHLAQACDSVVWLWDTSLWKRSYTFPFGTQFAVAWSPDSTRLAVASRHQTILLWEHATDRRTTLPTQSAPLLGLAWSPDGRRLASAGGDRTVRVWDMTAEQAVRTLSLRDSTSTRWVRHSDERWLTWTFEKQPVSAVRITDPASDKDLLTLEGFDKAPTQLVWSHKGDRLASFGTDFRIWDAGTGKQLACFPRPTNQSHRLAWSPDDHSLASWDAKRAALIQIWDTATGQERLAFTPHEKVLRGVAWSPSGTRLATWSDDGTAKLWDAESGEELLTLAGHPSSVRAAWSPDGDKIATASLDVIKIWDAKSGAELQTMSGHTETIRYLAWHPDGRRLASTGPDQTVKIWDVALGQELLTLPGFPKPPNDLFWSRNGRQLMVTTGNREVWIWDASRGYDLEKNSPKEGET